MQVREIEEASPSNTTRTVTLFRAQETSVAVVDANISTVGVEAVQVCLPLFVLLQCCADYETHLRVFQLFVARQ
jgi:hypothetical protein